MIFQNFLNGNFVAPSSESFLVKESPFTGDLLGQVVKSSAMDFILALRGAKKAAPDLRSLGYSDRSALLKKMAAYLKDQADSISYQEALHQGLPQKFVLENAIRPAIRILEDISENLLQESPESLSCLPTGVVSVICSWQLSLLLVIERLAPSLAAGNATLVKVSELSPITGELLGHMLKACDVPPGSVQILQGDQEVASLMASHPGIQGVTVVGSQTTLESVAKAGISPLKKLQLAGAAKNVSAVISGFDIENQFAFLLESFLIGQGQLCWNSSKLMILENGAADIYAKLESTLSGLQPLLDPKGESLWTPVISKKVQGQMERHRSLALEEKGNLFNVPLKVPEAGFYLAPTFMKDLTNCSVLHQDELAGPLFLVNAVKYQHEMGKWINNSYLGHSSYLWGDAEKALKVAQSLEVRHVGLNSWRPGATGSVFGGKQSSFGNLETAWQGSFYSNAKKLTMI